MAKEQLFGAPKSRVVAATIGVLLAATLITAAMPAWLPFDQANNIVMPIVFFPVTWLMLFFWVLFARNMLRMWAILVVLMIGNAALVAATVGAL